MSQDDVIMDNDFEIINPEEEEEECPNLAETKAQTDKANKDGANSDLNADEAGKG